MAMIPVHPRIRNTNSVSTSRRHAKPDSGSREGRVQPPRPTIEEVEGKLFPVALVGDVVDTTVQVHSVELARSPPLGRFGGEHAPHQDTRGRLSW